MKKMICETNFLVYYSGVTIITNQWLGRITRPDRDTKFKLDAKKVIVYMNMKPLVIGCWIAASGILSDYRNKS